MGDLSKNFSRHEFECKCGCGFDEVDLSLVCLLQGLRDHFGKPVVITSACRCHEHNELVGGSPNSKHKEGIAADIKVKGVSPKDVQLYLEKRYVGDLGIGSYSTFTHVDVRCGCARWRGN